MTVLKVSSKIQQEKLVERRLVDRLGAFSAVKRFAAVDDFLKLDPIERDKITNRILAEPDDGLVRQLVTDLSDDEFVVREEAAHKLERMGNEVLSQLQNLMKSEKNPEVLLRLRQILFRIDEPKAFQIEFARDALARAELMMERR